MTGRTPRTANAWSVPVPEDKVGPILGPYTCGLLSPGLHTKVISYVG